MSKQNPGNLGTHIRIYRQNLGNLGAHIRISRQNPSKLYEYKMKYQGVIQANLGVHNRVHFEAEYRKT